MASRISRKLCSTIFFSPSYETSSMIFTRCYSPRFPTPTPLVSNPSMASRMLPVKLCSPPLRYEISSFFTRSYSYNPKFQNETKPESPKIPHTKLLNTDDSGKTEKMDTPNAKTERPGADPDENCGLTPEEMRVAKEIRHVVETMQENRRIAGYTFAGLFLLQYMVYFSFPPMKAVTLQVGMQTILVYSLGTPIIFPKTSSTKIRKMGIFDLTLRIVQELTLLFRVVFVWGLLSPLLGLGITFIWMGGFD